MREEANPRKLLRRAVDYGASPAPITVSHSDFQRTSFATLSATCAFGSSESPRSASQPSRLIAIPLLESPVTHSKQTTVTSPNRYYFGHLRDSPGRLRPVAKQGRFERFFSSITARAS